MFRALTIGILVALAAFEVPAHAQGVSASTRRMSASFSCDRLGVPDGLPNSDVRAILQDKRGFMWFGTADGLSRHDGVRFQNYRPNPFDARSISSAAITALALDANGKLWVGTENGGVDLYDPDTDPDHFTRFTATPDNRGLSSDGVNAIARDSKGRMWFAMSGGGLNRYEPDSKTFTHFLQPPMDGTVTGLAADAAGNLWLGTADGDVLRWNPDNGPPQSFALDAANLGEDGARAIVVSATGTVWVGTDGAGLFALDPASGKLTPYHSDPENPQSISDDHIFSLYEDPSKTLWIGTQKGLNELDAKGHIEQYRTDVTDPRSLAFPEVRTITRDSGGLIWLGGVTGGLCKFSEARQKFGYTHTEGYATSFFEDPDGSIWVGSDTGGLYRYDRANQRVTTYTEIPAAGGGQPFKLNEGFMWALHRDKRGILWMAIKGQGLVAFDVSAGTYQQFLPDADDANSLPVDNVLDIWEDANGTMWFATYGGGLVRFDPDAKKFTSYTVENSSGLTSNILIALYPDPNEKDVLWIGTGGGGLDRLNMRSGTATSFRSTADNQATLSLDDVRAVHVDKSGIVWAGTWGGGFNRLDPSTGKVERFTSTSSKLTNDRIAGILPDDAGNLWISTSGGGLVQFDPKTKAFTPYSVSDGLQDSEFAQGSYMRAKSGELFFGGAAGFNAFMPKDIARDTFAPPIVLTSLIVGNQERKLDQPIWSVPSIKLSYADTFELQFAALSYAAPGKNRYAYKLEGYDKDFILTDRPFAPYGRLDGGKYTFRVRAANPHGVWNETGIALKVAVTPPFWRTWPAYGFYLLVLLGAAFLVFWLQRQRMRRVERDSRLAVVEQDLALTAAVQTGFLPDNNEVRSEALQLYGFYRPADACSGDWWWYERVSGDRHLILVGDVTGHGPGPAMVTAAVATAFRVMVGAGLDDVDAALELLNREVLRVGQGKYHMTMAALEIFEDTGRWKLYSAGAPPMLGLTSKGKHRVYFCAGSPLGTAEGFEIGVVEGALSPTDRLLLYTDGMPEIELGNGNTLGMRRFAQLYESTREHELKQAATTLVKHADQIQAGAPQLDDWTFAMIQWSGERTFI